jgi:phosphate transport system substrate-binding protein
VFGFSFLEENIGKLQGVSLEGVAPTFESIADGSYKASRKMFVYVKKAHIGVVPGLDKFMAEYVSEKATGEEGYLPEKGLVALPAEEHKAVAAAVLAGKTMTGNEF